METIRVNMTPCEDIKTIHASQNDNEAREWRFELHNNGEKIDSSSISDQMVFKAYEGGTEQILPENGSTPTTSPFKGDIRYPQGLLMNQQFTYRESPTEEDGLANIVGIKGQTLKWNQLIQNGNFASTDSWTVRGTDTSFTVSNNVASITAGSQWDGINHNLPFTVNQSHKFLVIADIKGTTDNYISIGSGANAYVTQNNVWQRLYIELPSASSQWLALTIGDRRSSGWTEINAKNVMLIDLTMMFGSGNEPTFEEFASLFPLDYYPFSQGSLIPFMGNGIKTVGKNLLMPSTVTLSDVSYVDGYYNINVTIDSTTERRLFGNWGIQNAVSLGLTSGTYIWTAERLGINTPTVSVRVSVHGTEGYVVWSPNTSRYINADDKFFILLYFGSAGTYNGKVGIQFELGSTATAYEPYTSSTLSLPISTYFPNGMKSAGTVYDELTPRKAITRIGAVDLGTLDWTLSSPASHIFRGKLTGLNIKIPNASDLPNALLANYQPYAYNPISANDNGHFALGYRAADVVDVLVIIDSNYSTQDSFISHISGQYLYYELATPIETSFTTASLVTENAEIPLSNEDGTLIGKCTEQLSAEPGFHDAKIKLTDADGECYSNKIQFHVERSPQ